MSSSEAASPDPGSPAQWVAYALGPDSSPLRRPPLTVWAQIDLSGQIESCQCRLKNLGGLAHQAGLLTAQGLLLQGGAPHAPQDEPANSMARGALTSEPNGADFAVTVICVPRGCSDAQIDSVVSEVARDNVIVLADGSRSEEESRRTIGRLRDGGRAVLSGLPRGQEWAVGAFSRLGDAREWRDTSRLGAVRRLKRALRSSSASSEPSSAVDFEALARRESSEVERLRGSSVCAWSALPVMREAQVNPAIAVLVDQYREGTKALLARVPDGRQQDRKTGSFVGAAACAECHASIAKGWQGTRHARALESLTKEHRADELDCVRCHVTGLLEPGGYAKTSDAARLGGVQCEACHGPGWGHPGSIHRFNTIGVATCVRCHDAMNSPSFVYDRWQPRVACSQFK